MKQILTRAAALALACALMLPMAACGGGTEEPADNTPVAVATPTPTPTPEPDPYEAVRTYWSEDQLTQAWGPDQVVEHLFFHPVIAYPEFAFSDAVPQDRQEGLDDWMVTADEFKKILQSVYDKGYILVNMGDVWSEVTGEDGVKRMERNTLMLPEGKKPLVISFDDVNYYDYMLAEGFTSKLVLGEDGQIWAECTDPFTKETFLTQELDATPILDQFVLEHPDFSLNGAKAIFSLTGYQGILGYRTQNDIDIAADDPARPAFDARRQAEIEAVKPVIERLKETGWTFGSHTWGHIRLDSRPLESIQRDTVRWQEEVGSLVGPTNIRAISESTAAGRRGRLALHRPRLPVPAEPGLPHLCQRGHQLLLLYQEGHLRRHLRPAPPRRHHPAQRQGPGVVQAVLRRPGDHRPGRAARSGRHLVSSVPLGALPAFRRAGRLFLLTFRRRRGTIAILYRGWERNECLWSLTGSRNSSSSGRGRLCPSSAAWSPSTP